jgi:hypothetical protein
MVRVEGSPFPELLLKGRLDKATGEKERENLENANQHIRAGPSRLSVFENSEGNSAKGN